MLLKEEAELKDEELDVNNMARGVSKKLASLYFKANAKLSPPVIMNEALVMKKLIRLWNDVDIVVRKQKVFNIVKNRLELQLDKLFDLMYCHCPITCTIMVSCNLMPKCSHMKIMCCAVEFTCTQDNCSHKKVKTCVEEIPCSLPSCSHKKTISCQCPKDIKLPTLDLPFIRAQRLKDGEKSVYQIGLVDQKENREQQKTLQRKAEDQGRDENRNRQITLAKEQEIVKKQEADQFLIEVPDVACDADISK